MKKTITTTIPHSLGQVEARQRLETGFVRMGEKSTDFGVFSLKHKWVDNEQMSFEGSAIGQLVSGRLFVFKDFVRLEIDVPPMLAAVAKMFMTGVKKETAKLLGEE